MHFSHNVMHLNFAANYFLYVKPVFWEYLAEQTTFG